MNFFCVKLHILTTFMVVIPVMVKKLGQNVATKKRKF